MATAGWYSAPGEAGLLRYWSGDAWTDHRQPEQMQPEQMQPVQMQPAQMQPAQGQTSGFHDGVHVGLDLNGIPLGPGSLSQLPNFSEIRSTFASAERQAQDTYRAQPRSTALKGALMSLVVGLVMIVLGGALILYFSGQESVGPGEVTVQGTVVGSTGIGSECQPEVDFQVAGKTYEANSGVGGLCSTAHRDESVDVIFSAADPAHTGRYDFGNPIEGFILILPILGAVVFVSGLVMFFVRLFRRRSQLAQPAGAP